MHIKWEYLSFHASTHATNTHRHYVNLVPRPRSPRGERVWHTLSHFLVLVSRERTHVPCLTAARRALLGIRCHGNKLLSHGMLSLQNQETALSVPDPFPLLGGGVRDRDYHSV